MGSGVAGASAGFAFVFGVFDLSLGPWPFATLKFRHLSCINNPSTTCMISGLTVHTLFVFSYPKLY